MDTQLETKDRMIAFKATDEDVERLAIIARVARRSKSDVLRLLIEDTFKRLNAARPQDVAMEAQLPC